MSKNLFSKSISEKKVTLFKTLAHEKIQSKGFVNSTEHLDPKIEFYNDEVKLSKRMPDYKFTNFVRQDVKAEIKTRIQELALNLSIVDSHKVDEVTLNDKIKRCIELYYAIDTNEDPLIFKSDLANNLGNQVGVRVYSKLDLIQVSDSDRKAVFRIILIDPFHLVIPSSMAGKTKEQMEEQTYRENAGNGLCMSNWFQQRF